MIQKSITMSGAGKAAQHGEHSLSPVKAVNGRQDTAAALTSKAECQPPSTKTPCGTTGRPASLKSRFQTIFSRKDRLRLILLMCLMIPAALLEMAGLTMLVPIIDVVSNPDKLQANEMYATLSLYLQATEAQDFVIRAGALAVAFILLKNIYLFTLTIWQARWIKSVEINVTNRLLSAYLTRPYLEMAHRNSADLIRNVNQEVSFLFNLVIGPILRAMAEIFVAIGLVSLMLIASPAASLFAFGIVVIGALIFMFGIRRMMKRLGLQRQEARGRMIEWATQSLQAMKELLVARKESYFLGQFKRHSDKTAEAEIFDMVMGRVPQLFIETFAVFTMISVVVFVFLSDSNLIATLSLFALVLVRMVPMMNRIATSVSRAKFYWPSLAVVAQDLEAADTIRAEAGLSSRKQSFKNSIEVRNISFTYPATHNTVLHDVSLQVKKGEIISIIGASGSGKTTLMDIMLGLLTPEAGEILMDGKPMKNSTAIRSLASYLPQSVYLLNASIRENIAFGVEADKINDAKIKTILAKVGLKDMVDGLPEGLNTRIGDISKKISGGQQQRIGIARALYHEKDILFLDEATAGLDPETEKHICETLKNLTPQVTILSISHQAALINIADRVYHMHKGVLKETKRKNK